jgi:hypothetical protein
LAGVGLTDWRQHLAHGGVGALLSNFLLKAQLNARC